MAPVAAITLISAPPPNCFLELNENTFLMGGVSSHAGIFSTSQNLANYAQMYINKGTWLGSRIFNESIIISSDCKTPDS